MTRRVRWFRLCSGRGVTARPAVSAARGPLVRVRWVAADGAGLPSLSDSLPADEAWALGRQLKRAAKVARRQSRKAAPFPPPRFP